jgi:hypothetical protein
MFLKWIGMGILVLMFFLYDTCVNGPKREVQRKWDRDHYTGWRLERAYDDQHGLYNDKLDGGTCTTKGYPGYPACPAQRYYVNGVAQLSPPQ